MCLIVSGGCGEYKALISWEAVSMMSMDFKHHGYLRSRPLRCLSEEVFGP
jgi:hypothetical protein